MAEMIPVKDELAHLRSRVKALEESEARLKSAEVEREKWLHQTRERTKELECLYHISRIVDKHEALEEIIPEIVKRIPASWQYPRSAAARVHLDNREYLSQGFRETPFSQKCPVRISSREAGFLEVCYLEKMPDCEEGPFLIAERNLLEEIAERLGKIAERKQAERDLRLSQEKLRELFEYLQNMREDERKRIAREIHDELGQTLTALNIDVHWLKKKIGKENALVREKADSMAELIEVTIENLQRIISELRPVYLEHLGLNAAIAWLSRDFQKRTGITCELKGGIKGCAPGKEFSIMVYRMVQELLTNVTRHANATEVRIELSSRRHMLNLSVTDNGRGISESQIAHGHSMGLLGLRERVNYWGGELSIKGVQGKGTELIIRLPLEKGPKKGVIRLLVVDDHPITLSGLRQILEEAPDIMITDEAETGEDALEKIKKNLYDIIVLDIMLPDINGLEVLRHIRALKIKSPVIVYSMYPEESYALIAMKAGASGFLTKKSLPDELVKAIRMVAEGKKFFSPACVEKYALELRLGSEPSPHERLSSREYQVMHLIATGKTAKEIASELSLSVKTISTFRSHILEKMSLGSNAEIIRYAIDHRLIY